MTASTGVDWDEMFDADPNRDGRNYVPVPRPGQATDEQTGNGRHFHRDPAPETDDDGDDEPELLDDDPFMSPAAEHEEAPAEGGRGHGLIGFGAVGTVATVGGLIVAHLLGGGILLIGAAGAAVATPVAVYGIKAARRRKSGAGTSRTPKLKAPRLKAPKLKAPKLKAPKIGGAGRAGGAGKVGGGRGRAGTGGPKPGKVGGARSTGLGPKGKTPGAGAARRAKMLGRPTGGKTAAGKGGRFGMPGIGGPKGRGKVGGGPKGTTAKGRTPKVGTGPRGGPRGGKHRTPGNLPNLGGLPTPKTAIGRKRWGSLIPPGATGKMRKLIDQTPGIPRRHRRRLLRTLNRVDNRAGQPRGTRAWRLAGATVAGAGGMAGLALGGWIPAAAAAGLGLALGTRRGRRALRAAGYHVAYRPLRATVLRPLDWLDNWAARTLIVRPARWAWRSAGANITVGWKLYAVPALDWLRRSVWANTRVGVGLAWAWARALPRRVWRKVRRRVEVWRRKFLVLARHARTRQAWAAFWQAAVMALSAFMLWIGRLVWAPKAAPAAASSSTRPVPDPDAHDDEQDSDAQPKPTGVPPNTPPPDVPAPAGGGAGANRRRKMKTRTRVAPTPPPAPAGTRPGGPMHPYLSNLSAASLQFVQGFEPRSIPDLERYLRSQPTAMQVHAGHYDALTNHLIQQFPGASGVHALFRRVADGYRGMSERAFALHQAYRQMHAGDLARHEQPRVNEHLADIARHAHGGNVPTIAGGDVMHENHACMTGATRQYVANYWPANAPYSNDAVTDLMCYLDTSPECWFNLGTHMRAFATKLVTQYPVDTGVHAYYFQLATGFADLSDASGEVAKGYRTVNQHDVDRREKARTNEEWADYANK